MIGTTYEVISAFPVIPPSGEAVGFPYPEAGMSLRDYFAAEAINGMLSDDLGGHLEVMVQDAYRIADMMLAERKETH